MKRDKKPDPPLISINPIIKIGLRCKQQIFFLRLSIIFDLLMFTSTFRNKMHAGPWKPLRGLLWEFVNYSQLKLRRKGFWFHKNGKQRANVIGPIAAVVVITSDIKRTLHFVSFCPYFHCGLIKTLKTFRQNKNQQSKVTYLWHFEHIIFSDKSN